MPAARDTTSPTPTPSESSNDRLAPSSIANKLAISSLLNPTHLSDQPLNQHSASAFASPSHQKYSYSSSPSQGPEIMAFRPQPDSKVLKHGVHFQAGDPTEPVNYPPFDPDRPETTLSRSDRQELIQEQSRFNIFPSGRGMDGRISDYIKRIPYSSDKKTFNDRTGIEAFNVFSYIFQVPSDASGSVFTVMWDYQNGLVRVTPFFKALKHNKTSPGRSLKANPGLEALSHSITGGALAAQGYWMPMTCARAVCATFCYDIRWALTPVFGFDFVEECLPPTHPDFNKFKIRPEIVRAAAVAANGSTPAGTPASTTASRGNITSSRLAPRSVPAESKILPPRAARPTFNMVSPFDSDSDLGSTESFGPPPSSPEISPKTKAPKPGTSWLRVGRSTDFDTPTPPTGLVQSSQPSATATPTQSYSFQHVFDTSGPAKRRASSRLPRPAKRGKTSAAATYEEDLPSDHGAHHIDPRFRPTVQETRHFASSPSNHAPEPYGPTTRPAPTDHEAHLRRRDLSFSIKSLDDGGSDNNGGSNDDYYLYDGYDQADIEAARTLLQLRRADDRFAAELQQLQQQQRAAEGERRRSTRRRRRAGQ